MTIKKLQNQCGTYAIAKMLKNAGFPLFMARHLLAVK